MIAFALLFCMKNKQKPTKPAKKRETPMRDIVAVVLMSDSHS
jgi:hypothetical protein